MPNCATRTLRGCTQVKSKATANQETDQDPDDQADSRIEVERRLVDGFQWPGLSLSPV
jgi:hypothetical protein